MRTLISVLESFRREDDGAVTVDWVVLTAVIVGLAIPLVTSIKGANDTIATKIGTSLAAKSVD